MKHTKLLILLTLLTALSLHPPHLYAKEKNLVIINSYNDGAPWAEEIMNPILTDVSNLETVTAEIVNLSNTLIHNEQDYHNMVNGLFSRFMGRKPDYLVLIGNFAFTLRDRIVKEWGNVPILLVAQSDKYAPQDFYYTYENEDSATFCKDMRPLEDLHKRYNFSLVQTPNLYEETIDMMKYMLPNMNRLVFVADALYLNRHLNHEIKEYLAHRYPDMEYEWLRASDETTKQLQQYLANTDYNTGLLLSTWFFERLSIHGYPQLIAGEVRMISSVKRPVFGLRYAYLSYGILGGYFPSPDQLKEYVRASLADMLSGKNMSEVPFRIVQKSLPVINYDRLLRYRIPESACLPDTVFINKPKTIWEQYKVYIIAGLIVVGAIIVMTIVLLMYQRRRIEMLRSRDKLVGNMPIGYSQAVLRRDTSGKIIDVVYHGWNEMFETLLKNNEMPGKHYRLFEHQYIADFVERLLREGEGSTLRFSYHFDQTDTDYEFLASVSAQKGENTEYLDIFAVDITDQKKKEEMLIEAREKAMESDKLKMAFLANMSHEIRTPLNAIVGFSSMLLKTTDPVKKARFVDIIEHNNELLLKLISDVLDTAKVESNTLDVHIEPTDINKVLESAESTVRLRLPKGVALNLVLGQPECIIDTDSERLNQVVINFLTNAIKFTRKGFITLGYDVREKDIYFYVRDTGQGIAPEDMKKLFTRFTKLNDFVQGTGLGLSISKSIVERLGGRIGAESKGRDMGSLFWFTLPLKINGAKIKSSEDECVAEDQPKSVKV